MAFREVIVIVTCILTIIFGIISIAIGAVVLNSDQVEAVEKLIYAENFTDPHGLDLEDIFMPIWCTIVIGVLLFIMGIFGLFGVVKNNKPLKIIYLVNQILWLIFWTLVVSYMFFFMKEWKLKFKEQSRRYWKAVKIIDPEAVTQMETELSCCGYSNALDYCTEENTASIMYSVAMEQSIKTEMRNNEENQEDDYELYQDYFDRGQTPDYDYSSALYDDTTERPRSTDKVVWPFKQEEEQPKCGDDVSLEFLFKEGDERCLCYSFEEKAFTPSFFDETCTQVNGETKYVGDMCGRDKFGNDICILNGCGDIIGTDTFEEYIFINFELDPKVSETAERLQGNVVWPLIFLMIGFFIFLILAILATFCSARGSESWIKCCEDQKENPTDEQTRPEEGHYYDSPAGQNEEILPLYDTPS